jgi:alkylation response protein AidB-like acyl-CoA dehydrogenase
VAYRLSDEERAMSRTVRDFAERELAPLVAEAERAGRFPRERVLPRLAELGLLSVGVPEALGGAGGGSVLTCVIGEEIARVCGGFAIAVMASVLAPAVLVRLHGERASQTFLGPLLRGEILPALAFTEPGGGSDLASLRTVATKQGGAIVLNGSKAFITNGPTADVYLVAAVREDHAALPRAERMNGIGVHVVLRSSAGVSPGRPLAKLGMRSSETSELHLENAPAMPFGARPAETTGAGAERGGFRQMMELLDLNRLYIAALSIGIAQAAFEASLGYVTEREAFGKPIAEHQATGFKLARMATQLDAARALLQSACDAYDAGERAARLASEAKLFASEAAIAIASEAVQIHGGYGYVEELPVERYFRDARVGTIWEGTSEVQQQIICRELGLYRG